VHPSGKGKYQGKVISKISIFLLFTTALLFHTPFLCGNAQAISFTDAYIGADDHGYGDVIGKISEFEIFSAEMSLTGTILNVDIDTNFAGLGKDKKYHDYTKDPYNGVDDPNGIGYGDLFLSSAWAPYGLPSYDNDYNSNGTLWKYGFALDDRWAAAGGSGILYQLNGATNNANALLSEDFIKSGPTFRNGQEVAVDINAKDSDGNSLISQLGTGTWSIDTTDKILSFNFDISATTLLSGNEIALHWGPTCANDVIEGSADPVPEPAALFLLGAGLIGFAGVRRKFPKKHKI